MPELDLAVHCRWDDEGGVLGDTMSKIPREFDKRFIATRRGHNSFTGYSRADLNILYNAADIYVQNSAEGFGLTVAEAQACGVPVVGIDYSAVPEVVGASPSRPLVGANGHNRDETPYRAGEGGYLVRWDHLVDNEYDHAWAAIDELAFAEAVVELARKPARRRALGKAGAAHVRQAFTWDQAARRFATIIEGTLSGAVAA